MQAKGGIPQLNTWSWERGTCFGSDIQPLQACSDLGQCYVHPQLAANFAFGGVDNAPRLWYRIVVHHTWYNRAPCIILYQQCSPPGSDCIERSRHPFCKTLACLAMQLQLL